MRAWLATVVGRVCLNILRSRGRGAKSSRRFTCPTRSSSLADDVDPEQEALVADSVGLALLVVLDALSPGGAARVRAARRVRRADSRRSPLSSTAPKQPRSSLPAARGDACGAPPSPTGSGATTELVDAFFAASRDGDFEALLAVLDPDVELRIDGGVLRKEASLVLRGADAVARHTATYSKLYPSSDPRSSTAPLEP